MGKNQDPGSGINIPDPQHCFFHPWIRDGENPDFGFGIRINIQDHISESLVSILWLKKNLKFFVADPGSGVNFPNPEHCLCQKTADDKRQFCHETWSPAILSFRYGIPICYIKLETHFLLKVRYPLWVAHRSSGMDVTSSALL